jgi:hypothetical protein
VIEKLRAQCPQNTRGESRAPVGWIAQPSSKTYLPESRQGTNQLDTPFNLHLSLDIKPLSSSNIREKDAPNLQTSR